MEVIDFLSKEAVLTAFLLLLFSPILYFGLSASSYDDPVEYNVPTPEQCRPGWDGEILSEPSIKVSPSMVLKLKQLLIPRGTVIRVLCNTVLLPSNW
jgi:hypothetical protein